MRAIPTSFRFLTAATTTVALATVVVAARLPSLTIYPADTRQVLLDVAVLVALAVVAESLAVEFSDRITVTAANLPVLIAMMFLGPAPAMAVAAVAGAWGFWRERSVFIAVFNTANYTVAAFLGSVLFFGVYGSGASESSLSAALLAAGLMAAAAYEATNLLTASLAATILYRRPLASYWRSELPPFVRSLAMLAGLGLMTAALYITAGLIAVVLLFIPLFASQYMFKLLVREKQHVAKQKELSDQYLEMNIGLAAAMVVLLDSKDEYTAQHSAAVAMYCRDMATGARPARGGSRGSAPRRPAPRPGQGRHARRRARQDREAQRRGVGLHAPAPGEGRRGALPPGDLPGRRRHRALPPRAAWTAAGTLAA